MSFHTLQISSSHHSAMFHSAFVFEHEHRIHKCIFMHTIFVTIHICLHPTTFSGSLCLTFLGVAIGQRHASVAGWIWEHSDERSHEAASLIWDAGGCERAFSCPLGSATGFSKKALLLNEFYLNEAQSEINSQGFGKNNLPTFGCFPKWWYPQNTPKWSLLVGKPNSCWGNPPF